jgi:hypothetical protein
MTALVAGGGVSVGSNFCHGGELTERMHVVYRCTVRRAKDLYHPVSESDLREQRNPTRTHSDDIVTNKRLEVCHDEGLLPRSRVLFHDEGSGRFALSALLLLVSSLPRDIRRG